MPSDNPRPWLIIAGDFAPQGGMDLANFELARFLADNKKAPVHLVAHRIEEPLKSHANVQCHLVARPRGSHFLGSLFLRRGGRWWARFLEKERPFVVVNGDNCRLPAVNWAHFVHAKWRTGGGSGPLLFRLKSWVRRQGVERSERDAFQTSRLVIANSEKTRRDLIETVGVPRERIHTVYLGVDAQKFSPITPEERRQARKDLEIAEHENVLLFVGALGYDNRKGFDTVIKARKSSKFGRELDFRLLAVGSGAIEYWRRRANAEGVGDRIDFLGARSDVSRLLAAADVLLSPTRYESYGLNVHEALCRGLPAIVAHDAGVAERVPPELSELTLPNPEDAAELAARIEKILSGRSRLQPMLDALGERLRRWTWADMSAEMVRLIESHF